MSESKKTYKFLGGKHYVYAEGVHKLLEKGETVEMTDKVFYGVRDRFELVPGKSKAAKSKPKPVDYERLIAGNVEHVRASIKRIKSEETLDVVEAAEKANMARSGVLTAIASRRDELAE